MEDGIDGVAGQEGWAYPEQPWLGADALVTETVVEPVVQARRPGEPAIIGVTCATTAGRHALNGVPTMASRHSVVTPSKCSLSASASALV